MWVTETNNFFLEEIQSSVFSLRIYKRVTETQMLFAAEVEKTKPAYLALNCI